MNLPRIALFSSSTGVQAGGAEAYTFAVARGLRAVGVPVTLLHGQGADCPCHSMGASHATGPVLSRDGAVSGLLRRLGVYRATRTSPYDLEVLSRGLLSRHDWKGLAGFDVVEVQYSTEAVFFRYAAPSAMKILHLHGPSMPPWLPRLCRACGTEPDLVLTCSEWSRRELLARNIPWPVEVNYNGIDEELFHPAGPAAGAPQDRRVFRIGFVGRLSAYKGIDTLADTARRLGPGFEMHVVGPVEGGHDLPYAPNLIYRGVMEPNRVAGFLRGLDCFYFPSMRESFGIAVVEAMSTGLPVIASAVGGLPEIISSELNGILIPVGDSAAAAVRIRQLSENPAMGSALGRAARATVLERFTTAHTARRLLALHTQWRLDRAPAQAQRATAEVLS